jgi:glycosyltransferase involved in cell wall biosynthesis
MTLDILIPHYKEPETTIKYLLDSIQVQQGIDFSKIKVIIVNDGHEVVLSKKFLKQYTFNLQYIIKDHEGASAARNKALEVSTADYVMFCDADDMFIDCTALWQIFINLKPEITILKSAFVAEILNENLNDKNKDVTSLFYLIAPKSQKVIGHSDTFVHGKVFKRHFLIDNDIKWPIELGYGEDSYFCKVALSLADNVAYYDKPFYL